MVLRVLQRRIASSALGLSRRAECYTGVYKHTPDLVRWKYGEGSI